MPEKKNGAGHIMIVDDDAFLLDMYALKFTQNGFQVEPALGTPQALEKIQASGKGFPTYKNAPRRMRTTQTDL